MTLDNNMTSTLKNILGFRGEFQGWLFSHVIAEHARRE